MGKETKIWQGADDSQLESQLCGRLRLGGSWFKANVGKIVGETPPSPK
jgi:hypothetical protein